MFTRRDMPDNSNLANVIIAIQKSAEDQNLHVLFQRTTPRSALTCVATKVSPPREL